MENKELILEQIEAEKKRLIESCPFKKGDILEWESIHKSDISETKRGTFEYIHVNNKIEVSMRINLPVRNYLGYSSSYVYVKNPNYTKYSKIENPYNIKTVSRITDMIDDVQYQIDKKIKILKGQKERLVCMLEKQKNKCVHIWEKGMFDEPVRTERDFLGQTFEYYIWTCSICETEIESI